MAFNSAPDRMERELVGSPVGPDRPPARGERSRRPVAGFTLIELMVVIAIVVLAAGLMAPTITDFFRNRQLETVRGQFGAALNKARLEAVTKGLPISVVFFREGTRVYDQRTKRFIDEYFNPELAPAADDKVWFELGFVKRNSTVLPRYRDWEKAQAIQRSAAGGGSRGKAAAEGSGTTGSPVKDPAETFDVSGLPRFTFERDGSVTFNTGSDVASSEYKREFPDTADIVIKQVGNNSACFMDLRPPGQFRSKVVLLREVPRKPDMGVAEAASTAFEEPGGDR